MKNNYFAKNQLDRNKKDVFPSSILWVTILAVILTIVKVSSFNNAAVFKQILACNFILICLIILKKIGAHDS
jgi:hypothetical protein